jgi:RNA polymerase sigma-70 factor (ECF subfamily)
VNRQSRFVFRVAYALLRNTHDAEEVVQETFLKIYRSRAWQSIHEERAFLARAAWRIAVDRIPKRRNAPPDPEAPSNEPSPEEAKMEADKAALIHKLIDALPDELRQPLALTALEEWTSKQVAEVMGIPEGTVRTRVMRAREILKQKLVAYGR